MKYGTRIFFSLFWITIYWLINTAYNPIATVGIGRVAGNQFHNNDVDYVSTIWTFNAFNAFGAMLLIGLALILFAIWVQPLRLAISQIVKTLSAMALLLIIAPPQPADAYYNKADWPEIYFILPNESAFFIPDVGANKDSQAAFGSEAYLSENKIAAKRFQIPHVQLKGSSYSFDFYIPAGRLIIVDRTPYAREWTKDAARGSAANDQSLQCQSKDGLDVDVEIALSATVFEENAARFLYRFGVKAPAGDRNTDEVKFASVFQGKSLTEVMDTVVHGKVQGLICKFFSSRSLDTVNAESETIMTDAEKATKEFLIKEFGITLDYIGWGGTFEFSKTVQKAIDDKYAADKIASVMPILERQAQLKIQEGVAEGIRAFGEGVKAHGLPSNLVAIPENLMNFAKTFTTPPAAAPAR